MNWANFLNLISDQYCKPVYCKQFLYCHKKNSVHFLYFKDFLHSAHIYFNGYEIFSERKKKKQMCEAGKLSALIK